MTSTKFFAILLLAAAAPLAQAEQAHTAQTQPKQTAVLLQSPTTLPIVFTRTIDAKNAHPGDPVAAKTSQVVRLANGVVIPSGTKVTGHVLAANGFVYDNTPYAKQKPSELSIRFDSVEINGNNVALNATVRAMADPVTSQEARAPMASDVDPKGTVTQIGGDQLVPSQSEVRNSDGDVVGYNRRGQVYAHLIANGHCDSSDVEVSMGLYSASACGLYGYAQVAAAQFGSAAVPSTLTLISTHVSPRIWKASTALLEVVPTQQASLTQ